MIAFELMLNGNRVCVAGAEDLTVLTAHITASGKLGSKTASTGYLQEGYEVSYSVGGLTGRRDPAKDVHVRWRFLETLKVGDVLAVKVVNVRKADRTRLRTKANRKRR